MGYAVWQSRKPRLNLPRERSSRRPRLYRILQRRPRACLLTLPRIQAARLILPLLRRRRKRLVPPPMKHRPPVTLPHPQLLPVCAFRG